MASISGIFYKKSIPNDFSTRIENVLSSIPKFGDDVCNFKILSNVALGQILSEKSQNFSDHRDLAPLLQDNILISQYARIDNKANLCKEMELDPNISSQELVLALYKKYGKNFALQILGDFIIAIWDNKNKKLTIATDIVKSRPAFYYDCDDFFAFSTHVSALHQIPEIKREPNLTRIANQTLFDNFYLDQKYLSYYKDIYYTPGNTLFEITQNTLKTYNYWHPKISNELKHKTESELVEEFKNIFAEAIKSRTNVPSNIGIMLSGGLDSSALTAMTCKLFKASNRNVEAFCNVLPLDHKGYIKDEREFISLLKTKNLNINYMEHATEGPFDDLKGLLDTIEYPLYISQQYIHKAIGKLLQEKNVRVLLDGIFGEIGPTFPDRTYFTRLFLKLKWITLFKESRLAAKVYNKKWLDLLFRRTISTLIPSHIKEILRHKHKERVQNIGILLNDDFVKRHSTLPNNYKKLRHTINDSILDRKENNLKFLEFVQQGQPLKCYFEYTGVELLHPYLDRRIIEFCLSLPDHMHSSNGYSRYFIRRSMQKIMPDKICTRLTKAAFVPDYMERYHNDLDEVKRSFAKIKDHPKVKEVIDLKKLEAMITSADRPGSFMGEQNIEAFMIVPTTLAVATFLANF